jgi:hypothetical protein
MTWNWIKPVYWLGPIVQGTKLLGRIISVFDSAVQQAAAIL